MRALLAVCTVLLNCSVACAQTASGVVRAMDGTPLEGVPVTIYGITVTTSPDGSWSASNPTGVGGEVSGSSWGRVKGSYRGAPPASGAPALRTMNTLTIDPTAQGYYKLTHEFAAPPEGYLPSVHPPADLGGVTPADVEWNILHSAYLPGNPLHWEAHANGEPVPVELVGFGAPGDRPAIQNIIGSLVLGNPGGQYLYPNSWEETWDTASATDGVRKDLFYEVDHVNGVTVKGYRIEKCASYCPYSALPISDGNGNLAIVYMTRPHDRFVPLGLVGPRDVDGVE